jgi:hypothetical protein
MLRAVIIFLLLLVPSSAHADKGVALVIGNSAYQHAGELANPKNDAADMAAALKKLGFTVIEGLDLGKGAMERKIREFAEALSGSDVGLLFYAGHGLQVGGQNYLVPVDAKLTSAAALDFEMIRLDLLQRTMERETKTNIIFLDACRDNPLARNLARALGTRSADIGRGLASVESGVGTLVSFSTQPGNVALDGEGRNSPFAGAVVKQLLLQDADIGDMLIRVRNDVIATTRGRQVPWEHSALTAKFYFTPPVSADAPKSVPSPLPGLTYEQQMEIALWNRVKDSKDPPELQAYIDQFPQGAFAPLARVLVQRAKREEAQRTAALREELLEEARKKAQAATTPQPPPTHVAALPSPAPAPAPPAAVASSEPSPDVVRGLQRELQRVGCGPGSVDGIWGGETSSALKNFARYAKARLPSDEPTPAALAAVTAQKGRVCPLQCGDNEYEHNGRCVAKAAKPTRSVTKAKVEPKKQVRAEREQPAEQSPPQRSSGGTRLCLGITCVLPVPRLPF